MNNIKESLAKRLLYLPIDVGEKVLLWLTYRDLKPISEITVQRRNFSKIRRGIKTIFDEDHPNIKRIKKWIKDAGLFKVNEPEYKSAWHVGKDKSKVEISAKIIRQFDFESEVRTGTLFGFPKASVRAYAENRNKSDDEIENIMTGTGDLLYKDPYLKDKYFTPYIFYNMPKSKVIEESQVARNWADTIRKDIPKLADWFEKTRVIR